MKKLTLQEIEQFSIRKGVKKIAVENFLMTMGVNSYNAGLNLLKDAKLYNWDYSTVTAIYDGIGYAIKEEAIK